MIFPTSSRNIYPFSRRNASSKKKKKKNSHFQSNGSPQEKRRTAFAPRAAHFPSCIQARVVRQLDTLWRAAQSRVHRDGQKVHVSPRKRTVPPRATCHDNVENNAPLPSNNVVFRLLKEISPRVAFHRISSEKFKPFGHRWPSG